MKKVIITQMSLLNFKGIAEMQIAFSEQGVTSICGRNGSGKTTIFDAFTWVLFGKDSQNRQQFDIKTLDKQGVAIPRIPHEATINLLVDGQPVTLTRRYTEKWTKKRGSAVEEFTGHEEERLYNDVPCNLKDWNAKIEAICPEMVFKFITNPDYFTSQKWGVQREMLFRMAGGVTDEEIAAGNEDFSALLDKLTGKTMDEYKREIAAKKKRIKAETDTIPGRIDECYRLMPEPTDYKEIEKEIADKTNAIADIDARLTDISKALKAEADARHQLVLDHAALGIKKTEIERAIRSEVEKAYRQDAKMRMDMESELERLTAKKQWIAKLLAPARAEAERMKEQRTALIAEYRSIMAETMPVAQDDFVCPTCGRPLELADIEKKQQEMQERFNERKAQKIADNKRRGQAVSKDAIASKEAYIAQWEEQDRLLDTAISDLRMKLQAMPEPVMPNAMPTIKANAEWQSLTKQEKELMAKINMPMSGRSEDNEELREAKSMLQASLDELKKQLSCRDVEKRTKERIGQLEEQLRSQSQELAELEGIEFTMAAFTKARIEAVERKINSLFTLVKFKMYDQQINGGEVEKCEAVVGGVPYSSLNNAMQINAGLDIINAICEFEGISAPIFVDNAESVNTLMPTKSQLIRLVVTEDETLRIR